MDDRAFVREFARRTRRRRQACGFTQRAVAEAVGMSEPQYSRLEAGNFQLIHIPQLARLAAVLNTSVDYLLLRSEEAGDVPPRLYPGERPCPGSSPALLVAYPLHERINSHEYSTPEDPPPTCRWHGP